VLEIIAEPNRRAIFSLLGSSQQSVGEAETAADRVKAPASAARGRFRRIHGRCKRRLNRRNPEPLQEGMPGWLHSVGSGPLTWMLSNAISTEWINHHPRKGRQGEEDDRS
jgi:hypothetical protein